MSSLFKLLVKFKPEAIARVKDGRIYFSEYDRIMSRSRFILNFAYSMAIPTLEKNGEHKCEENGLDLSQYKGMVYVKTNMDDDQLQDLALQYQQLDIVEYVSLEPAQPIEPPHMDEVNPHDDADIHEGAGAVEETQAADNAPQEDEALVDAPDYYSKEPYISVFTPTRNLTGYQGYLRQSPAPGVFGIDAEFAWSRGARGQGIRMANIEWGHNFAHEDLVGNNFIDLLSTTNPRYNDHGAAVASITMARNNGFGMLGAAYNIDQFFGVSELPRGRVGGIAVGLERLRPGDVFLYQMQTGGRPDGLGGHYRVPPDFDMAVWDITRQATARGIVVVITAGNGGDDLSHPFYNEFRNRGDNGAIRVGAGYPNSRNRLHFSTFGQGMVHVQGWGRDVAAAGYGDLEDNGPNRTYTRGFNGTSSAGAVVAAAVVSIQSWYKMTFNRVLSSRDMRSLLIATGRPQGTGGHIGPLPNIRAAIESLSMPSTYPQWQSNRDYTTGDRVSWNGANWQARWWNRNVQPGTREPGGSYPWQPL